MRINLDENAMEEWHVEWRDPTNKDKTWKTSWKCANETEAREYMQKDVEYFYDYIEIRIVCWKGTAFHSINGSQKRK